MGLYMPSSLLNLPPKSLNLIFSSAATDDIESVAKTHPKLQKTLSPLLAQRADDYFQLCNKVQLASAAITFPPLTPEKKCEILEDAARSAGPKLVVDQRKADFFLKLWSALCQLSAKPKWPSFGVKRNLLNDTQTQILFDGLLKFAAKVPEEDRAVVFNQCLKRLWYPGYIFPAVESKKKFMLHKFLLELAKLMPDEQQICAALSQVQKRFSASSFGEFLGSTALENTVKVINKIKNEQLRGVALGQAIEKYAAEKMDWTGREAGLNHLLTCIDGFKDEPTRHTALCQLVKHYPMHSLRFWEVLPAVTSLLKTAASFQDDTRRESALGQIVAHISLKELEPGQPTKIIKALLAVVDTLSSDKARLKILSAMLQGYEPALPAAEKSAVVDLLTQSWEKLSNTARKKDIRRVQKWFPMELEIQSAEA